MIDQTIKQEKKIIGSEAAESVERGIEDWRRKIKRKEKVNLLTETRCTRLLAIDRLGFYTSNLEKHHDFLSNNKRIRETSDFSEANRSIEREREIRD